MMTIADNEKYQRHREARIAGPWTRTALYELWFPMLLFGSMGAITWAIRGTGGWGGIDGTILPGMTWGLLWYYLCRRKGIDARAIPLWLGLGIALGGELGYGQYVSWIRGMFNAGDEIIFIAPWIGYAWFVICGIGWGAPGGIALGWALSRKTSLAVWLVRLLVPVGVALLARLVIQAYPWLFFPNWSMGLYVAQPDGALEQAVSASTQTQMILAWLVGALLIALAWAFGRKVRSPRWLVRGVPVVALVYTAVLLVRMSDWLFFPEDDLGLFDGELGKHLGRTVYTNSQNAIVVAWWIGALLVAAIQRDRSTLTAGALIGGGFGIGFMLAALWCLGYVYAPSFVDWWKMWELNAGFNLGLLYVAVLYWAVRQIDKTHDPNGAPRVTAGARKAPSSFTQWCETASLALGAFLVVYVMGREEFRTVAIFLGLFYVVALCLATLQTDGARDPQGVAERRRSISLIYAAFLLLFIMFWGASSRAGILLGLYEAGEADQYAWPAARVVLFAPAGVIIGGVALFRMWRILGGSRTPSRHGVEVTRLRLRMVDLMTVTGVVGAVTIWPAKIGVMYALFLCLAIFAFNRLDRRFEEIDALRPRSE